MATQQVVVIGGGPAGLMAAIRAAQRGLFVTLLEGTPRPLNKLRITGKGRCNVTNAAERDAFLEQIVRNPKFFRSAFSLFDNGALMALLESAGVELKVERGLRVFPENDKAETIASALSSLAKESGVRVRTKAKVQALEFCEGSVCAVILQEGERIPCGACIVATGGMSYPVTGSTGDGYRLAKLAGHTIVPPLPSLAPIWLGESWIKDVEGLSLKNVSLRAKAKGKTLFDEQGELLFTANGISGPLTLSCSAVMDNPSETALSIDLKPALSEEQLDGRLQRELSENANKAVKNIMGHLFARSLCPVMLSLWGVGEDTPCHQVTRAQRQALIGLMKALPLTPRSVGPLEAAVVTRGGITVREVNPKTMASKLIPNLYFAGEVLDIDGMTGGFNLQIAFSTGYAAGNFCEIISTNMDR